MLYTNKQTNKQTIGGRNITPPTCGGGNYCISLIAVARKPFVRIVTDSANEGELLANVRVGVSENEP